MIRPRKGISALAVFAAAATAHQVSAAATTAIDDDSDLTALQQTAEKLRRIVVDRRQEYGGPDLTGPLDHVLADTTTSAGVGSGNSAESPQVEALRWLSQMSGGDENLHVRDAGTTTSTPQFQVDADADLAQRYALAVLYFATGGDGWRECSRDLTSKCESSDGSGLQSSSHFLSTGSVCAWFGLTCSDEQKKGLVTWIDLSNNGLSGSIPDELSLLSNNLELLWLSSNSELGGSVPQWIGDVTHMQSLSFFDTAIGGTIPDSLYNLSKLSSLRVYGSKLEGTISTKIGQLSNMQWLWMHGCELTGAIPSQLGSLKKLEALTLHGNAFGGDSAGTLPTEICNLRTTGSKKLEHLWTNCDAKRDCDCCTKCFPAHVEQV